MWLFHPVKFRHVAEITSKKRIRGNSRWVKKKKERERERKLESCVIYSTCRQRLQTLRYYGFPECGPNLLGRVPYVARTRRFRACWARSIVHLNLHEGTLFLKGSLYFSLHRHPAEWIQLLQTCLQCEMKTFSKQHQFATIISHDKDMNRSHNGYKQNTTNRWRQTQAFKICI